MNSLSLATFIWVISFSISQKILWYLWSFPYFISKPSLVLMDFNFSIEAHLQAIFQIDLRWPLTLVCDLWPHQQMKLPMLCLQTKFGSNWTWTFQLIPILHFQAIWQLDKAGNTNSEHSFIHSLRLKFPDKIYGCVFVIYLCVQHFT